MSSHMHHSYSADDAVGEVGAAVTAAVRCGYRLIDCAMGYGNQHEIGNALAELIKVSPSMHVGEYTENTLKFIRSACEVVMNTCPRNTLPLVGGWHMSHLPAIIYFPCVTFSVGCCEERGPFHRVQAAEHAPLVGRGRIAVS